MSTKKLSPEEELEKQYSDYKAQFEQWKEKNKGSEHTEGYVNYVKQFEKWEKDVEARRIAVRNKSQQERLRQEAAQNEERQRQDETVAAARYAKQQEQYMSVHVRALEEQERVRKQQRTPQSLNSVPPTEQHNLSHQTPPIQQPSVQTQQQRVVGLVETADVKSHVFGSQHLSGAFEIVNSEEEAIKRGPHIQADPQPIQSQQNMIMPESESKPLLWGEDGGDYPSSDPMNTKWGIRAAPPNLRTPYRPPNADRPIIPSWYLQKKMEEAGLFYGSSVPLQTVQVVAPPADVSIPPPLDFSIPPPNVISLSQS